MTPPDVFNPPLVDPAVVADVGWTLLHFLWQGAALAVAFWTANLCLRRRSPQGRYLSGCAVLALMAAAPVVTYFVVSDARGRDLAHPAPPADELDRLAALPFLAPAAPPPAPLALPAATAAPGDAHWTDHVDALLPWLVALWGAGVALLALRRVGGWVWLTYAVRTRSAAVNDARLSDLAARLVRRPVRFLESALVDAPATFGLLRPVVLLPAAALTGLPPACLEAVVAHELAHVRRLDYLVNVLQAALEAVLFYHPAVWWVSKQVRLERENCCDDVAAGVVGDRTAYARALERLESLRPPPASSPASAAASAAADLVLSARGARGGTLMWRVGRLLGVRPYDAARVGPGAGAVWILACAALLVPAGSLLADAAAERDARRRLHRSVAAAVYRALGVAPEAKPGALDALATAVSVRRARKPLEPAVLEELAVALNAGGRPDDLLRACLERMRVDDAIRYQMLRDWKYGSILDRRALIAAFVDRARPGGEVPGGGEGGEARAASDGDRRIFARAALLLAAQGAWFETAGGVEQLLREPWLPATAGLEAAALDRLRDDIDQHRELGQRFMALKLRIERPLMAGGMAGAGAAAARDIERTLREMAPLARHRPDLQWHLSNVTWRYASTLPAEQRAGAAALGAALAARVADPHFTRWVSDGTGPTAPAARPLKPVTMKGLRNLSQESRDQLKGAGEGGNRKD